MQALSTPKKLAVNKLTEGLGLGLPTQQLVGDSFVWRHFDVHVCMIYPNPFIVKPENHAQACPKYG
jgi:hypothetical protein